MTSTLKNHYTFCRPLHCGGMRACDAIRIARSRVARGERAPYAYGLQSVRGASSLGTPFRIGAYDVQWCERPPFRLAGSAYDMSRRGCRRGIDHMGWYLNDFCDETASGAVYLMTGRDGKARAIPALADPYNDGMAALAFGDVVEVSGDGVDDALAEAARTADSIAQAYAEKEREYQRAWQAGVEAGDADREAAEARQSFLTLRAEARDVAGMAKPALCAALASHLRSLARTWSQAKAKAADLAEGQHGDIYWDTYDVSHRAAFEEGRGAA